MAPPFRVARREILAGAAAAALSAVTVGCQTTRRRRVESIREVERIVAAAPAIEGAGVSLRRSLGGRALPMLDPFLLLDEIRSDDPADWRAGFPSHPHRGFETVSYLIEGAFVHRDSVGNHGRIADGGAQWMTAGSGIIHSEMPDQVPGARLWGLQLWVNLPAARKMSAPRYQDLEATAIPEIDVGDARVRVVAGAVGVTRGPVDGVVVQPLVLDARLEAGAVLRQPITAGHHAFVYGLDGSVAVGRAARSIAAGELAILETGGTEIAASSPAGGRALVIAAAPIGEPVARRGPFVMNTAAELREAFADYRAGRLVR